MQIQISWLLKKPTDLDLHCLQRQGISGFSRTRVKYEFKRVNFLGRSSLTTTFLTTRVYFILLIKDSLQQHIHLNGNIFWNKCCYCNEGSLYTCGHKSILVHLWWNHLQKIFFTSLRKHTYSNIEKISPPKSEKFQIRNADIFHISAQNIDCGYSLAPRRGGSNEYPQSVILSKNKKTNIYPCKPQFYYIEVGFKGVKLYRHVFVMHFSMTVK